MTKGEAAYLYQRVETELSMAERATDLSASAVHHALANLYLARLAERPFPMS